MQLACTQLLSCRQIPLWFTQHLMINSKLKMARSTANETKAPNQDNQCMFQSWHSTATHSKSADTKSSDIINSTNDTAILVEVQMLTTASAKESLLIACLALWPLLNAFTLSSEMPVTRCTCCRAKSQLGGMDTLAPQDSFTQWDMVSQSLPLWHCFVGYKASSVGQKLDKKKHCVLSVCVGVDGASAGEQSKEARSKHRLLRVDACVLTWRCCI